MTSSAVSVVVTPNSISFACRTLDCRVLMTPQSSTGRLTKGRVLVTHDITTLANHAFERVAAGLPMPGVFAVSSRAPIGSAIDDLLLLAECSLDGEWEGQVRSLPL